MNSGFWRSRRVLVTGHTGFKGAWLCLLLRYLGAEVSGVALPPPSRPNLFESAGVAGDMDSVIADIRDAELLRGIISQRKPEVVFHLAAQSLVRPSYEEPAATFDTNVMGTVNLLEACRASPRTAAIVIVTSDKCYENTGDGHAFAEQDRLGAGDPYSTSKACAELVAACYRRSYPGAPCAALATVRAGNVIGGGDWSRDRLLPDLLSAFAAARTCQIRQPSSVRPWQHVLDPLSGYLRVAEGLHRGLPGHATAWNFGPDAADSLSVSTVAALAAGAWGEDAHWQACPDDGPAEAELLRLDSTRARSLLGWQPVWTAATSITETVDWQRGFLRGENARGLVLTQIRRHAAAAGCAV